MIFSKLPFHASVLPILCLAAFSLLLPAASSAQDRLVFKDNHVQEGMVVGMSGNSVLLSLNTASGSRGQIGFDLNLLSRVDAAPPAGFQAGMAAYAASNWDKALADLKPIAEQFRGLPTPWAQQTFATLGDLYVEKNDVPRAEAAYNDYRRLYPAAGGDSLRFNLGQARIALARNNVPQGTQQLAAITRAAFKNPAGVSRSDGAAYGEAFYLSGQLQEHDGDNQAALKDYLLVTTLFYQDAGATARARKSADNLRAAHKELVAP